MSHDFDVVTGPASPPALKPGRDEAPRQAPAPTATTAGAPEAVTAGNAPETRGEAVADP